jgi:hypothetical protein
MAKLAETCCATDVPNKGIRVEIIEGFQILNFKKLL